MSRFGTRILLVLLSASLFGCAQKVSIPEYANNRITTQGQHKQLDSSEYYMAVYESKDAPDLVIGHYKSVLPGLGFVDSKNHKGNNWIMGGRGDDPRIWTLNLKADGLPEEASKLAARVIVRKAIPQHQEMFQAAKEAGEAESQEWRTYTTVEQWLPK
ncbi:MAG: hypothetical protein HY319_32770 [Armatimonadetes bacterium]|nr:hypothetical protein [Armatimonadota bacterium]